MQIREWAALFLLKTFMIIKHLLALPKLGLLNYGKNHNHDYFGQYWNQNKTEWFEG